MPLMIKNAFTAPDGNDIIPNLCNSQSLLVLMTLAQLLVVVDQLFTSGLLIDWGYFGLATLYVQWQALASALLLCRLRTMLKRFGDVSAMFVAYFLLLLLAIVLSVAVQWASPVINAQNLAVIDWHFIIKNSLLSAIIMGVGLHYIYLQQRILVQQKAELHADLLALQARIRPHFLFNCLNSIASLIAESPAKAEQTVVDLSELLRASLREGSIETSIEEEWQLCQHYLQIEACRLSDRLGWTCDFSELDTALGIPNLSLQPIVENAIYHGIQPNPVAGTIEIIGKSQGSRVEITVINSQQPHCNESKAVLTGHKMALSNIRERLHRLYGKKAILKQSSCGDRYTVTLHYNLAERSL